MKELIEKLLIDVEALQFAEAERRDPYANFNFLVEISGHGNEFAHAGFRSVDGLSASNEEIEYREGGDNTTPRKMPGRTNFDNVTFERGMSEDTDMWDWFEEVFTVDQDANNNDPQFRATITVQLMDRERNVVKAWELQRCWIVQYETGDFDAEDDSVMIETMEVAHEGIKKVEG